MCGGLFIIGWKFLLWLIWFLNFCRSSLCCVLFCNCMMWMFMVMCLVVGLCCRLILLVWFLWVSVWMVVLWWLWLICLCLSSWYLLVICWVFMLLLCVLVICWLWLMLRYMCSVCVWWVKLWRLLKWCLCMLWLVWIVSCGNCCCFDGYVLCCCVVDGC